MDTQTEGLVATGASDAFGVAAAFAGCVVGPGTGAAAVVDATAAAPEEEEEADLSQDFESSRRNACWRASFAVKRLAGS